MPRRTRRFTALLLGAGLLLAGCTAEPTGPANTGSPDALLGGLSISLNLRDLHLAVCGPTPYDSTAVTIGPRGGTLTAGRHRFVIPAGALDSSVTITMVNPGDGHASARFGPEGLRFDPAHLPTLTLDYSNCLVLGTPHIVYVDDRDNLLEVLKSFQLLRHSVSAPVGHFSRYAVAW